MPTFLCRRLFSVGNVLLSMRVELSKRLLLLSTNTASWICNVEFFSSHASNLGFTFRKNVPGCVLITCVSVTTRSPCLTICCSVLLHCFIEVVYGTCKFAAQPRCKEMLIPGFPTCTPDIICSEGSLYNGYRRLLVIWTTQVKNSTKRAGKYHFPFIQWLLEEELLGHSFSKKG